MRPLPTIALLLASACVTPGFTGLTDTQDTHDTPDGGGEDTDVVDPGPFNPTKVAYEAQIAVNGQGKLAKFTLDGETRSSSLEVVLSDARGATCVLRYALEADAFELYSATSGQGEAWTWMDGVQDTLPVKMGFVVKRLGYTGSKAPGGRCDDLPAAWSDPSLFENARTLQGSKLPTFVGIGGAASADVKALASDLGFLPKQALGGLIEVPFSFDEPATDQMAALVVWAPMDGRGNVEFDGDGVPVYGLGQDAIVAGVPERGWYHVFGEFDFASPF